MAARIYFQFDPNLAFQANAIKRSRGGTGLSDDEEIVFSQSTEEDETAGIMLNIFTVINSTALNIRYVFEAYVFFLPLSFRLFSAG